MLYSTEIIKKCRFLILYDEVLILIFNDIDISLFATMYVYTCLCLLQIYLVHSFKPSIYAACVVCFIIR